MKKGALVILSGFSGVGKGTVAKRLVEKYGYSLSVSATTRQPREGEVDGRDYFFKTEEEFRNLIDYNGFIEYARYVENFYGTPRKFVEDELNAGHNVILEIEVQGAFAIREQYGEIKNRLIGRGTESEEVIAKRLSRAVEESEDMCQYDYIIVNDDLEVCVGQVHAVVTAQSCERRHNMDLVKETMEGLKTL